MNKTDSGKLSQKTVTLQTIQRVTKSLLIIFLWTSQLRRLKYDIPNAAIYKKI